MDGLFVLPEVQLTRLEMGQDLQDTRIIDNPIFPRKDQEERQADLADATSDQPVQGAAREQEPSGDPPEPERIATDELEELLRIGEQLRLERDGDGVPAAPQEPRQQDRLPPR